jgi:hypothetical protein
MDALKRTELTRLLSRLCGDLAADLRTKVLSPGPAQDLARALHRDERVGDDFAVWTDLLSRRAAVLWVLKSVYVRVLEDRGLVSPLRIVDLESQQLFERLAPHLGETAYLRWVYRDLAQPAGGLPELFAPQPAEVAPPSDALSRRLLDLWRDRDPDSGVLRWRFDAEHFDGQFMGDLYQDLDPVVKDRYALLQTPAFVRDFILDRTLTPALAEWGAGTVRVLDPSCGSGHFLLESFRRLVVALRQAHPDRSRLAVVQDALSRVVGIDINDYACALARARLVMTALEASDLRDLAAAGQFHPQVYWADSLEQVEREDVARPVQLGLEGIRETREAKAQAQMTRPEVRKALAPVLQAKFHVVVANPPYITEKDESKREYHRERYVSASRQYSLASPFTERCFHVAIEGGYVGLITSNNFMKREFGKTLIEKVLAKKDLFEVVDTAGAFIPGHGTPTVILFARNRVPNTTMVRAVMGKRGEPSIPPDPATGKVWSSIAKQDGRLGFEDEFISVADVARGAFGRHPWSLGGGGAAELREIVEQRFPTTLASKAKEIGFGAVTREDDLYLMGLRTARRFRIPMDQMRPMVEGEVLRDWAIVAPTDAIWPYRADTLAPVAGSEAIPVSLALWRWRSRLAGRIAYGMSQLERGLPWFAYSMFFVERFRNPLSIAFAFVATHNHFVLDRGGKVFNRSAPVIKLPSGSTEDDHLALLGLLNSSTGCFWMKQVFHCKGAQGINEGMKPEQWMQFFEFDGTKIKAFPVVDTRAHLELTRALDRDAHDRSRDSAAAVLEGTDWSDAPALRNAFALRRERDFAALLRMVGCQEELDWLCYGLYGLTDTREALDAHPIPPTARPFEILLARSERERREALARDEAPDEAPTAWFERHGWTPSTAIPDDLPAVYRQRIQERLDAILGSRDLALIEQANCKRRWYKPDYDAQEHEALRDWLADRVESVARTRGTPLTARQAAAECQADPRVNAVAEVFTGRRDYDLEAIIAESLGSESVPSHPYFVYTETGLAKRAAWEQTWEMQRREDAGEEVTPPVPPAYKPEDFRKGEHFRLRGKLDVPKERFIAFTEVPGRTGADALYGWAGWTAKERVRALLSLDEVLEDEGVPLDDRIGVLDSAWRLLPDVAREDPEAAGRFRAELQALLGETGPSEPQRQQWKARFAGAPTRGRKKARVVVTTEEDEG